MGNKEKEKDILILGIETSCDETSASVVKNGRVVLSNVISSQIDIHKKFGGVVPEVASRNHILDISAVIDEALANAEVDISDIDAIGVTYAPGLEGALLVGVSYAKALSFANNIPLIGVHHILGHIFSNFLENDELETPFIALVVSGGHTNIINVKTPTSFDIIGKTRDDAVGECFDKVARVLNLPYPGGPKIDELSKLGDKDKYDFPLVMLEKDSYDFSFSGLKSSVLNFVNSCKMKNIDYKVEDVCASFQKSAIYVLVEKTIRACKEKDIHTVVLAGGVSANSYLREEMQKRCLLENIKLNIPKPVFCTDNGAMIAGYAYYKFLDNDFADMTLNARANLQVGGEQNGY